MDIGRTKKKMNIYTMGYTKKSAETFFSIIDENDIDVLIDVRLNNTSQLAGFTKKNDLKYFLKKICNCDYFHELNFAPTKEVLKKYQNKEISWEKYKEEFNTLLQQRNISRIFFEKYSKYNNILLLCTEEHSKNCHRRLIAEYINKNNKIEIVNLGEKNENCHINKIIKT